MFCHRKGENVLLNTNQIERIWRKLKVWSVLLEAVDDSKQQFLRRSEVDYNLHEGAETKKKRG